MLQILLIVVGVLVVGVLVVAASKPSTFRVERSTTISVAPDKVFPLVNDFHGWAAWSPWEKLDPALKRTFSGPASGKGAVYEWEGNSKAGQGRMEILDAPAPSRITIQLDFLKPFKAHNTAEFAFEKQEGATHLRWVMTGASPFMIRLMGVFVSMDKMVGKDFETGLANLKALAEK